jgi:hypothetical protein
MMGWRLRAGVRWTPTEYGGALLDTASGEFWTVNPTAAVVLGCLLAGTGQAEATRRLADEFDTDGATLAADVAAVVAELELAELVVRR